MPMPAGLADVRVVMTPVMRKVFLGQLFNATGNGLTMALIVVYLHSVRGIPIGTATSLLAFQALLGLVLSPIGGTLVDRFGPRPVLLGSILIEALGVFGLGQATTLPQVVVVVAVMALGGAGIWGPSSALVARLVPPQHREAAFGFSFMLLNLGLGLGGLIGASIIDIDKPATFVALYTVNASSYVAYFIAILSIGNVGSAPVAAEDCDTEAPIEPERGGWLEVLADRTLLRYAITGLIMLTFGYGAMDAGVAIFVTDFVGLDAGYIGLIFAFNTGVIVLAQIPMMRIVADRSRSRVMAMVGLTWALSWLLFGSAVGLPDWAAVAIMVASTIIFAIGETMWSPVAPALLNDLAPEHLRGRYNAFQSVLWGVSGALGPLITGVFLQHRAGRLWTIALAAGCLVGALLAYRLRRNLTSIADGTAAREAPSGAA